MKLPLQNSSYAKAKVQLKREIADAKLDEKAIEEARKKFAHNFEQNQVKFIYEVTNTLTEKMPEIEFVTAKSVVENEENAKKKKSEDDTRARLRGFARTIPSFLMAFYACILKNTQDNSKSTWAKVPLQDFTPHSDINWTASISDIDAQLYAKYAFDKVEVEFIKEKVKAME